MRGESAPGLQVQRVLQRQSAARVLGFQLGPKFLPNSRGSSSMSNAGPRKVLINSVESPCRPWT